MPLPAQRTVHGTVTDLFTGAGPTTTITITALPRRWTDAGGDQLLVSPDHTVPVTGGAWSIALVPTDAAGIEPVTGRYYRLQEVVSGVPGRARTFEAPTGDMTPISILALIVDDPGYRDTCAGRPARRGPPVPLAPRGLRVLRVPLGPRVRPARRDRPAPPGPLGRRVLSRRSALLARVRR